MWTGVWVKDIERADFSCLLVSILWRDQDNTDAGAFFYEAVSTKVAKSTPHSAAARGVHFVSTSEPILKIGSRLSARPVTFHGIENRHACRRGGLPIMRRHLAGRREPWRVVRLLLLAPVLWSGVVLALDSSSARRPPAASPESGPTNSSHDVPQSARHHSLEPMHPELRLAQAGMSWEEERRSTDGETVSVIVVEWRHHESNYFRDRERVRAYGSRVDGGGGAAVTSVQFASPYPEESLEEAGAPFGAAHPEGVDKRVRMVYITDFFGRLTEQQVIALAGR